MPATEEVQAIEELMKSQELILEQLKKVIIGQEEVINQMLMALFAGGHCLLEGVPGLAKTLMIRTLADHSESQIQADPVHPGSDASRHHGDRCTRRRPNDGTSHDPIHPGTDFRQHPPR